VTLVSVQWLSSRLGAAVVVDCRWSLSAPGAGREAWEAARIPGASHLDVDHDLSGPPGAGGRHPLPTADAFTAAARSAGIGASSLVVAYDEAGDGGAARLWWLLRHFGHARAAVLDGGFRAWREAGAPVEERPPCAAPLAEPPFAARERDDDVLSAEAVAARLGDPALSLVDARAAPRFRGEVEPIDPVAGHIPGAWNAPFSELAPEGRYLAPDELRARLDPRPGRELVAYCGSGVTAATLVLAASVAGVPARLYPGSWSEWCRRGLPVERA
jgi:thiosulfate/3-mercaptopyruvate sulfurtransferase